MLSKDEEEEGAAVVQGQVFSINDNYYGGVGGDKSPWEGVVGCSSPAAAGASVSDVAPSERRP